MNKSATGFRFRIRPSALAAFALAALLHAIWWYTLARPWTLDLAPTPLTPSPRLTYLPESTARSAARLIGSPVLFALPTPVGFSGDDRRSLDRAPAALQGARREPLLLERSATRDAPPDFLRSLTQTVSVAEEEPAWIPPSTRTFATPAGATGFVVRIYWPDGAPAIRGGLPGAGVLAPVLQDRPWELGAMLVFDERGDVRHVFIEKPTPSRDRNEALARALRGIRIDGGGRESRTRVVVQYDQDAGPRAPAGGAVRP